MLQIVITGSSGLIGAALVRNLRAAGIKTRGIDARPAPTTDILRALSADDTDLDALVAGADGIIHLAGVSRVVWGQADPARCWRVNVELSRALIGAALRTERSPWFIYASSREVYGQVARLPCPDDSPVAPLNIYACSKAAAEELVGQARDQSGLRGAVVRFSTVYGGLEDHPDRVIPAFVLGALEGNPLTVFGQSVAVDPTFVGDVVDGVVQLSEVLEGGRVPARPLLFAAGEAHRLVDLAVTICSIVGHGSEVVVKPPRSYDVERFAGVAAYAEGFLGWRPATHLLEGLRSYADLIGASAAAA